MGDVQVVQIPPPFIADVLPKRMTNGQTVKEALYRMQERSRGDVMVERLLNEAEAGREQLWLVWGGQIHAVIGTLIERTDTGEKTARIRLCVGQEAEIWVPAVLAEIEEWARHYGCNRLCIYARPGWTRHHLKEFRPRYVELERELRT